MKPSERISEIRHKHRDWRDVSDIEAIIKYLDEEYENNMSDIQKELRKNLEEI